MPVSQESIAFLFENRLHDSREWYAEHKDDYRRLVVEPLAELVTALTPSMRKIDPQFVCEPKIGRTLSRVYRDTRFSKDKSLYRDTAWFVFRRDRKLCPHTPAFFFEFSPRDFRYGCGYYDTEPELLERFRALITARDPAFTAALDAYRAQTVFTLTDERYKRSRFPQEAPELREWLDLKNVCLIHTSNDADLLFSEDLWRRLSKEFELIAPVYRFLTEAVVRN